MENEFSRALKVLKEPPHYYPSSAVLSRAMSARDELERLKDAEALLTELGNVINANAKKVS